MNYRAIALALALLGCGDDDITLPSTDSGVDAPAADAGMDAPTQDTGTPDASMDAGEDAPSDAGDDAAPDAGPSLETLLTARFGDTMREFNVAKFGYNADGSIQLELFSGAEDVCPTMTSPTPDQTVVIASISAESMDQSSLNASMLDFEGALVDAPFVTATSGMTTGQMYSASAPATLSASLQLTFAGGTIVGDFAAGHCASLDE